MFASGVRSSLALVLTALVAAAATTVSATGGAVAASRWAPADRAAITPGVQMFTKGGQCTGNFVFTDRRERVYVGYAAHCAEVPDATGPSVGSETDGCETPTYPLGTRVRFERGGGALVAGETVGRGRVVYSSWVTMQDIGTEDAATCDFNDFALVRVGRADVGKVNPSVPEWGGPVGLRTKGLSSGETVFTYGSSTLRGGVEATGPKVGRSTGDDPSGWSHNVYTATPGIPGDSGSGFLDERGLAFGVLSTVELYPQAGQNGVGDLARQLAFARQHSGIRGLRLVQGTEPFVGLG